MWSRLASDGLALPEYSTILGAAEMNDEQSSTITTMEQSFYQYISGDSSATYVGQILNGIFAVPAKQITITGGTASIPYIYKDGDYNFNIDAILTKQKGNYWMITDMQGLELPVGSNWRDTQRGTDLENIGNGLTLYYEKNGNYPTAITSWSDLEKALIGAGASVATLENDPLSATEYPYYYGANASGSILVLGLVLENPPQSTMLASYTGNLPNGVTWLTGTPPEPCDTATMDCFVYPKQ
jgi:hypothetical protein